MSRFFNPPISGSLNAFHDIAAQRGDGLHPKLREALAKTGSVSGAPAASEVDDRNVITVQFGPGASSPRAERKSVR